MSSTLSAIDYRWERAAAAARSRLVEFGKIAERAPDEAKRAQLSGQNFDCSVYRTRRSVTRRGPDDRISTQAANAAAARRRSPRSPLLIKEKSPAPNDAGLSSAC